MNPRHTVNRLLREIKILTAESVSVRWRVIDTLLKLLLDKRERNFDYSHAYVRNRDIVRKVRRPTSVKNVIEMLIKFKPQVIKPLDKVEKPPQVQFTKNGILLLKREIQTWNKIFEVTDEYDLLKPLVQILSQRLDEVDRYFQGSSVEKSDAE